MPLQSIVGQLNVSEKVSLLTNGSPGVARVGLPPYEWWSEALHGMAYSPGVNWTGWGEDFGCATSFPEPIGLGATFDRQLVHAIAGITSDEARAFSNAGRAGLDFWTPNINIFRYGHLTAGMQPTLPFTLRQSPTDDLSRLSLRCAVCRDPRWGRGQETPGEVGLLHSSYIFSRPPQPPVSILSAGPLTRRSLFTCRRTRICRPSTSITWSRGTRWVWIPSTTR